MSEMPLTTIESEIEATHDSVLAQSGPQSTNIDIFNKIVTTIVDGVETLNEAMKNKEKRRTIIALGALGVATTIAEYKGYATNLPQPFGAIHDSDRHLEVGYISALLASRKEYATKRGKFGGMLLAGFLGNIVTETSQSIIVTGFIQDRWNHITDFLLPSQIFWNNTEDAAAAMLAASYAAFRETKFNPAK